jgi:hypothetical protein
MRPRYAEDYVSSQAYFTDGMKSVRQRSLRRGCILAPCGQLVAMAADTSDQDGRRWNLPIS